MVDEINFVMSHYTFLEKISGVNIVMADLAQGICEIGELPKPNILTFDGTPGDFRYFKTEVLDKNGNVEQEIAAELERIPRPRVLLCHNYHIPLFFDSIVKPDISGALLSNTPVINAIHDYSSNDIETTAWLAEKGVTFTAVSKKVESEVTGDGFECSLVKNAINTNKFRPNRQERTEIRKRLNVPDNVLLLASYARAVPRKQFPVLVEAFAEAVGETDKQLRLYIRAISSTVEPGKTDIVVSQIRQAMDRCNIEDRIILETNPVPWETSLAPYFNAADLLVYPSINEGFGLQIPEAIATGTPVICSDIGTYAEIVDKLLPDLRERVLFPAGDVEALTEAIVSAVKDHSFLKRSISKARERAQRFYGLGNMVNGYINVSRKLIGGS